MMFIGGEIMSIEIVAIVVLAIGWLLSMFVTLKVERQNKGLRKVISNLKDNVS